MMKKIHVAAAIILDGDKVLATQRSYGQFQGGWEFPGGKIEDGETPEMALKREIKEELDGEIFIDKLFEIVEYDYPNFRLKMYCFICRLQSRHLILKEHQAAKWLEKDSLENVEWLPADIDVIRKLKKYL